MSFIPNAYSECAFRYVNSLAKLSQYDHALTTSKHYNPSMSVAYLKVERATKYEGWVLNCNMPGYAQTVKS